MDTATETYYSSKAFAKTEPAEVYQEAALSLRYKRITAMNAIKLKRAMALLQLEPRRLVERGLAPRSCLLEQGLNFSDEERGHYSSSMAASSSNSFMGIDRRSSFQEMNDRGKEHGPQEHQGDGWSDYGSDCNSDYDSECDSECDADDGVGRRRKYPIYAFLVYGGVQLRPDEYVLLFRALGVSPQYVERLENPKNETGQRREAGHNSSIAPSRSSNTHDRPGRATHLDGEVAGRIASSSHRSDYPDHKPLGASGRNTSGDNIGPLSGVGPIASDDNAAVDHVALSWDKKGVFRKGGGEGRGGTRGSPIKTPRPRVKGGTWRAWFWGRFGIASEESTG